jgi:hypothetical protein
MNKKTIYNNQIITWKEKYEWEYDLNDIIERSQNNINTYLDDYGRIDIDITSFIKRAIWSRFLLSSVSYNARYSFGKRQYKEIIRKVMPYIYYQQPLF